jgi:hypothetical protein
MKRLRIQYASGFQFTGGPDKIVPQAFLKPVAPVLAIASHVTNSQFLQYCSRNWEEVFVLGYPPIINKYPNIWFLNCFTSTSLWASRWGVTFLGTLLNTRIEGEWLGLKLNDLRYKGIPTVVITEQVPSSSLVRAPVRAWIADDGMPNMNAHVYQTEDEPVQCVINRHRAAGYSREIFVDISTESGIGDTRDPLLVAASQIM